MGQNKTTKDRSSKKKKKWLSRLQHRKLSPAPFAPSTATLLPRQSFTLERAETDREEEEKIVD